MDSLTIIFILNGVFFISFFLLKNIYISFGLSLITLFALLFFFRKKNISPIPHCFQFPQINIENSHYVSIVVCIVIFLILQGSIGFDFASLVTFFIFAHLNKFNSRVSYYIVLIIIAVSAFLTAGGNARIAEPLAVLAYYLLIIGAVWQIIEHITEKGAEEGVLFESQKKLYHNSKFLMDMIIVLISVLVLVILCMILFFVYNRPSKIERDNFTPAVIRVASVVPTPFSHVPFAILNATDIRGYSGVSMNKLHKAGWNKEFDLKVGNYKGTASANILRFTPTLKNKIKLLENDLKIKVTHIMMKDTTRSAEMTLILGK